LGATRKPGTLSPKRLSWGWGELMVWDLVGGAVFLFLEKFDGTRGRARENMFNAH